MSNWRKLAWEVQPEGPPGVGDRVTVYRLTGPPGVNVFGVVESIYDDQLRQGLKTYRIRTDEGDIISGYERNVHRASLEEVPRYKFQVGQQVRVKDSRGHEGGFPAIIKQAARDSCGEFYVVSDEMGAPHVLDWWNIEAISSEDV